MTDAERELIVERAAIFQAECNAQPHEAEWDAFLEVMGFAPSQDDLEQLRSWERSPKRYRKFKD